MAAATGLIDAAEATRNPWMLSGALLAYGFAFRDADPVGALDACRRGLVIAQDSGNRANESYQADSLARLEAKYGDPLARVGGDGGGIVEVVVVGGPPERVA